MSLQKDIIASLGVKPFINPKIEFRVCVNFIKEYLKKYNFIKSLILGISGGQDSTLVGKICRQVIDELRTEHINTHYNFIAVRLPYGKQKDEIDCYNVIKFIKPDKTFNINIKSSIKVNRFNLFKVGIFLNKNAKINEKARERMKILYSIANMTNGIVVGTSNSSELITGYFTKYGDGGSDINPLFHLNKRQGREILKYLNCPKSLYLKSPIADSGEELSILPDELELGISYDEIDDYLEGKEINKVVANKIESLYKNNKHKRKLSINVFDIF